MDIKRPDLTAHGKKNFRNNRRVSWDPALRDDPHGELGDLKSYGLASPTHDTELNCFTNTTHGLARTAPLLLPRNSRYPDSPPEICYGTDFATTASVFSSFIWGLNFSTLPWPAANYFILCRRW